MINKKKILVIDDEEDICDLVRNALVKTGLYEVLSASDPVEGCRICEQEHPDLVVLDYVMPNMRGDQVIAHLHKTPATEQIPIILVSGLGEIVYYDDRQEWQWKPDNPIAQERGDLHEIIEKTKEPEEIAKIFGVAFFLFKPFTRASFLNTVDKVFKNQKLL